MGFGVASAFHNIPTITAQQPHTSLKRGLCVKLLLYSTMWQKDVSIAEKLCLVALTVRVLRIAHYVGRTCFGTSMELTNIFPMWLMSISNADRNVCLTPVHGTIAKTIKRDLVNKNRPLSPTASNAWSRLLIQQSLGLLTNSAKFVRMATFRAQTWKAASSCPLLMRTSYILSSQLINCCFALTQLYCRM